jgi:cytochrome c biogenesis protein CcdA
MSGLLASTSDRLWLSFGGGLLAAVNPCGFVLLPTYLMYYLGVSGREEVPVEHGVTRALRVSLSVSAGFMTVFIIVGSISRLFTDWLNQNAKYLALVIGVGLFALGIAMLFGYRLPLSTPKLDIGDRARDRTFVSMYLFGVAYAIASIGCTIGPFSATVLGTIDTDGFVAGLVAVVLYGIAMSLLVSGLTVSIALARSGLLRVMRTGMRYVEIASAVIMILSGSYLAWYWFNDIREKYDDDLTGRVIGWQERLSQWIDGNRTSVAVMAGLVVVAAAVGGSVVRRQRRVY